MRIDFTIISNIAVTAHIIITHVTAKFFIKGIYKIKQYFELAGRLKNNFEKTKTQITINKFYKFRTCLEELFTKKR